MLDIGSAKTSFLKTIIMRTKMLFHVRTRDGSFVEPKTLEEAIDIFVSEEGYRLSFVLNDEKELHIYRDEYNDNHPSQTLRFVNTLNSQIADAKVIITNIKKAEPLPTLNLVK